MVQTWDTLVNGFDRLFPIDSPRRGAIHIVAIVLIVEGLSVFALFSKVALSLGVASFILGIFLLLLLQRGRHLKEDAEDPPGLRLLNRIERLLGGPVVVMIIGAIIILLVIVYNQVISERPEYGDVDTISMMFGVTLIAYPQVSVRYKTESSFGVLFVGFVMVILVAPQVLFSMGGSVGVGSIGNWYVHYMLAAPFAGILDLIGVPASSFGDLVTLQFQDGSVHTLRISAYCAGLYSFSIFLSAFMAFVLVFERLSNRTLILVLASGVAVAYLGNLLRMVVIGLVGYYRGLDALYWAHENAGWIVFLAWSSLFWWLILGYVSRPEVRIANEPGG